jgi:hypothetical protein
MSVNVQLDQAKAAAFEGRLVEVLNAGALSLMVSVGHRTRLFDAMAELPPATSIEIARSAQLQERYVREWLGAMVAAGVVAYDAASQTYRLPQEHAAYLTHARRSRATLPFSPSTSRPSAASRTTWSAVLARAAACLTRAMRGSTRSWPRIAGRPSCRS